MNIKKRNRRLTQVLFFILPIFFFQNTIGSNDLEMKETVIKITDTTVDSTVLIFKESGEQKVTVKNYLQKDIVVGDVYFIGDEFTTPLVARDISVLGYSHAAGLIIKAGTSYSFIINASQNATPTVNPDGEELLLGFKIIGEKESKYFPFKIKIDYNNDIIFKKRNLEFYPKPDPDLYNECYNFYHTGTMPINLSCNRLSSSEVKKLTIMNNGSLAANIKSVQLARNGSGINIGNYSSCYNLKSGTSCEVDVTTDGSEAKNDVIPVFVTYDVVDESSKVVNKDLIAAAAVIVSTQDEVKEVSQEHNNVQPIKSAIDGAITGAAIIESFSNMQEFIKKIFLLKLSKKAAGTASDIVMGPLSGVSYFIGDKIFEHTAGKYDSEYSVNKIISATVMYSLVAFKFCPEAAEKISVATYAASGGAIGAEGTAAVGAAACVIATVGCGLLGTFGGHYLTKAVYSNIVYRLPEQSWSGWIKDKSKLMFNFGASAVVRVVCKKALGSISGGLFEGDSFFDIPQDVSAAAVMVGMGSGAHYIEEGYSNAFLGYKSQLSALQNDTTIDSQAKKYINSQFCGRKECVCTKLDM